MANLEKLCGETRLFIYYNIQLPLEFQNTLIRKMVSIAFTCLPINLYMDTLVLKLFITEINSSVEVFSKLLENQYQLFPHLRKQGKVWDVFRCYPCISHK